MVLRLQNPGRNRVDSSQYRMGGSKGHWYPTGESSSPAVLSCMFAWTRELLFTLTQAQVCLVGHPSFSPAPFAPLYPPALPGHEACVAAPYAGAAAQQRSPRKPHTHPCRTCLPVPQLIPASPEESLSLASADPLL